MSVIFVGPTPIHAPVPRPIVYSIGIGTSDYPDEGVTANNSGGPPQLNVSSFLNDLSAADTSSPVRRTPVSVLSPVLQRTFSVVSPRRPRLTIESGVNAVVCCSDASLNACVDTVDKEVQAVVDTADGSTCYEPQVEASLSASSPPPVADVPGAFDGDVDPSEVPSTGTTETRLEIPDDLSLHSPPSGMSAPGSIVSNVGTVDLETSPMGPSLLDSDDEPIASRLPG